MTSTNSDSAIASGSNSLPHVPVTLDSKGRVRVSKEQRRLVLAEFERSGISAAQFAKVLTRLPKMTKHQIPGSHSLRLGKAASASSAAGRIVNLRHMRVTRAFLTYCHKRKRRSEAGSGSSGRRSCIIYDLGEILKNQKNLVPSSKSRFWWGTSWYAHDTDNSISGLP